jgi:hypothetical protein
MNGKWLRLAQDFDGIISPEHQAFLHNAYEISDFLNQQPDNFETSLDHLSQNGTVFFAWTIEDFKLLYKMDSSGGTSLCIPSKNISWPLSPKENPAPIVARILEPDTSNLFAHRKIFLKVAQSRILEEWHEKFFENVRELITYIDKHFPNRTYKTLPKGYESLMQTNRETLAVNLGYNDLAFSYTLFASSISSENRSLYIAMRIYSDHNADPKLKIDSTAKLKPSHPAVSFFEAMLQEANEIIEKKREAFKPVEKPKDELKSIGPISLDDLKNAFERGMLEKIEQINKGSSADQKLDLWKEIQQVQDPESKQMLMNKFKSRTASRLRKKLNG